MKTVSEVIAEVTSPTYPRAGRRYPLEVAREAIRVAHPKITWTYASDTEATLVPNRHPDMGTGSPL